MIIRELGMTVFGFVMRKYIVRQGITEVDQRN